MTLNITSGEYFNNYIKTIKAGIFIPFNEAMITGPADTNIFSEQFIQLRSNYHNVSITEYKNKLGNLLNPEYIRSFTEINLWFGEDTFCVINLLTVLTYLEQINYEGLIYYTTICDSTNEVIKEKEELNIKNCVQIFTNVIINKIQSLSNNQVINHSIEQYLLLHSHDDLVSKYIKNNIHLDDKNLLINSLSISEELGLSDIIINKIINKFKYNYYNLFYNQVLISTMKLDLGTNFITYKTISNNESIFSFLKNDYTGLIDNLPFIKSRIDNMNKFNLEEVSYQTDNYILKKINQAVL